MGRNSILISLVFLLFFSNSAGWAEWAVLKRAEVQNHEKDVFRIERQSEGPVRAWLILKITKPGIFKKKMPLYQVDNNEIRDLKNAVNLKSNKKRSRWISWEISAGKADFSAELKEILSGKQIVFQYYFPDGTIKEAIFNIEGARKAIEGVLK